MCSILGVFNLRPSDDAKGLRRLAIERSGQLRHRGPDYGGVFADDGAILVHERLAIVDPAGGAQPLRSQSGHAVLAVNGEIYNHEQLKAELRRDYAFATRSDCEVILALDNEDTPDSFLNRLNGIFAFALWDIATRRVLIARDPIGVCPLYWGHDSSDHLWVASEMKALVGVCADVEQFPPGHFFDERRGGLVRYYRKPWRSYSATRGVVVSAKRLRESLESAVDRQLMSDVPYGILLSGGLDSSVIAACVGHIVDRRAVGRRSRPESHSFAIGLADSPDLQAARLAAAAVGTRHHGFRFTTEEGLDALPEVIRHVESYDITTVRASVPMYLLARSIRAMGFKMVLSGEGSDEIFGGYLYFHKAPSAEEFHDETIRKLDALHRYDCLRANKAMMAWGIEARVPFLDREFLDVAMSLDAADKMVRPGRIEKAILREAFDGYLPRVILWRQKEQFSDGVGYGWIDALKKFADDTVSDDELGAAPARFPVNPPWSKEGYVYRSIFERHFPACASTVTAVPSIACSTPAALSWDASFNLGADPSGRAMRDVHAAGAKQASA